MDKEVTTNSNISHYRVLSKIGAGGMGEVFRARDERLGRDVAIKVLPAEFSSDEDRLRRFELEARSAGSLNHPNILVIYQIGTDEGSPFIVSELLEGETLRDKMEGGPLPQRKALDYALQTARGLAAAHEKGIIHRDLKPENIFVTTDGRVKILDFGLAKLTQPQDGAGSDLPTRKLETDPGTVMGTVAYMSPEQVRARPLDQRTDIFSFGAIFYEMLTGRRPFTGESTADLMSAILREEPPLISMTDSGASPALERVIEHCLEKSPDERFRSASDLAFAIEALSTTSISGALVSGSGIPTKHRASDSVLPWALVGLLVAASGTLAYLLWTRPAPDMNETRFEISTPEDATEISDPMISADGQNIAFVAMLEGKRHLYIRSLNNTKARMVPGTENALHPFWSPDGAYVAFFADNKLRKVNAEAGPVQTICDVRQPNGGSWNADNVIVFGMFNQGLRRVSAAGGQPTPLLEVDKENKEIDHSFPVFLPDGNHFIYLSWRGTPSSAQVWVAAMDGTDRKHLFDANSNATYAAGHLLFARESTLMAQPFDPGTLTLSGQPVPVHENVMFDAAESYSNFSVSTTGVLVSKVGGGVNRRLAWFDRTGKQISFLNPPGMYNDVALSPDDKWVAVQRIDGERSDIWIFDTSRDVASRFTVTNNNEDDPVWSADSKYLYFTSGETEGKRNIRRKPVTGGADEVVADAGGRVGGEGLDVSADGKFGLIARQAEEGTDLWIVPLDGTASYPLLTSQFSENHGQFSPDGRWIAYMSTESGRPEVYVRSFPNDTVKRQVSNQGGAQPRWSRDGRELFYIDPNLNLVSVRVRSSSMIEFETPVTLFRTQIPALVFPNRYDVSADGQRFMINSSTEANDESPLNVVINWTRSLPK